MRTIKTHFLILTLASLGFAATAYADNNGKTSGATSSKQTTSKPLDSGKSTKTDSVVKIDTHKTTVIDSNKITTKIDPIKPNTDVVIKKDTVTKIDIVKKPEMLDKRVVQVHEISKTKVDIKSPGIKLADGVKFDHAEFAKITPKIDLTKVKPETVLGSKPPADFKVTKIGLDKIQLPAGGLKVEGIHAGMKFGGEKFIINKTVCSPDYLKLHAVKCSYGYCYPGKHHCHWHHCIWDPCFGCYYYYDPCACCYYYWSEVNCCYAPCYWFVEYQGCSYPWWLCGGFESFGYCGSVGVSIHLGIHIK